MRSNLAAWFRDRETTVIDYEGRPAHAALALDVFDGATLRIDTHEANRWRDQLLHLHLDRGSLETTEGELASTFTVQCSPDSDPIELLIHNPIADAATLHLWNGWTIGTIDHAWSGNSGFRATAESDSSWFLECSDGVGSVDFNDLLVRVEIIPPER